MVWVITNSATNYIGKQEQRQRRDGLSFTDHVPGRCILAESAERVREPRSLELSPA